jgi:hypothetical protein
MQSSATSSQNASAPGEGVRAESALPKAGVLDELSSTLASAGATILNFLDLISLEARRAGLALVWMVACGLGVAICVVAAWLGFMAALSMWAVSLGCPPVAAVMAVAVINLAAGAVLIYACIGLSRDLLFKATRRQLAGSFPVKPSAP